MCLLAFLWEVFKAVRFFSTRLAVRAVQQSWFQTEDRHEALVCTSLEYSVAWTTNCVKSRVRCLCGMFLLDNLCPRASLARRPRRESGYNLWINDLRDNSARVTVWKLNELDEGRLCKLAFRWSRFWFLVQTFSQEIQDASNPTLHTGLRVLSCLWSFTHRYVSRFYWKVLKSQSRELENALTKAFLNLPRVQLLSCGIWKGVDSGHTLVSFLSAFSHFHLNWDQLGMSTRQSLLHSNSSFTPVFLFTKCFVAKANS